MSAIFNVSEEIVQKFTKTEETYTASVLTKTTKAVVLNGVNDVPVVVELTAAQLKNIKPGNIVTFDATGAVTKITSAPGGRKAALKPGQTPCHQVKDC